MKASFIVFALLAFFPPVYADLPANYDLRSAGPGGESWVPAIQNQSNMEDCWTFATATALDSALIRQGTLPTSTVAPDIVISSWHLSAFNGQQEETAYVPGNGASDEWGQWGGFYWQSMAYLTRGSGSWAVPGATAGEIPNMGGGPVTVSANPLNAFPLAAVNALANMDGYLPPVNQPTAFQVTGVHFFNQSGSGRDLGQQIQTVKQAILNYGAAGTLMDAGGYTLNNHREEVFTKVNDVEYAYLPASQQNQMDHAVTIIGWNDNIQVPGSPMLGAWIVQNSWGSWGGTLANNDGTFYAAYDDKYIGRYVTTFTAKTLGANSPVVMQNELGPMYQTWQSSQTNLDLNGLAKIDQSRATCAVSLLSTEGFESLNEVGLYSFAAGLAANVSIYDSWGAGGPGTLLETQSVTFPEIGYTSFSLDTPIDLSLYPTLVVQVDYLTDGIPYVLYGSGLMGSTVPSGLSYFYDQSTGRWEDFASLSGADAPGVFFLKGIATIPEPGSFILVFAGMAVLITMRVREKRRG